MNIPETFYIALCVTILMLGVVYWFWTQIQYLQRKINLLDNVVYEMKTLVSNLPGSEPPQREEQHAGGDGGLSQEPTPFPETYAPPPESVAGDIEAEQLASEVEFEAFSGEKETSYAPPSEETRESPELVVNDELQPGGASVAEQKKKSDESLESPLNSLSIKELRTMAEANNIPDVANMRKRDLVRVLRNKVGRIMNSEPGVLSLDSVDAPNSD
jgi:hypothetical protein